ncbi:hypothetical protein VNO77_14019 [Canavalia gladiata]|uniref:Uncharacterized protein n=1 Tax=Canavalia gladiata TaxID=3824 RepID=A0AAN9LYF3_CANGL
MARSSPLYHGSVLIQIAELAPPLSKGGVKILGNQTNSSSGGVLPPSVARRDDPLPLASHTIGIGAKVRRGRGMRESGEAPVAEVRLSLKFDAPTEENPALLTPAGRRFFSVAAYNNGKRGGPNDLLSQRIADEGVAVRKRDAYRCGGMTEDKAVEDEHEVPRVEVVKVIHGEGHHDEAIVKDTNEGVDVQDGEGVAGEGGDGAVVEFKHIAEVKGVANLKVLRMLMLIMKMRLNNLMSPLSPQEVSPKKLLKRKLTIGKIDQTTPISSIPRNFTNTTRSSSGP